MKDYFALLGLKSDAHPERLVSKIQAKLGKGNIEHATVQDHLIALRLFSDPYLFKLYRAALQKTTVPPKWQAVLEQEAAKVQATHFSESELIYHFKESSFWLVNFWYILGRCLCLPLSRKNNAEAPGRNLMRLILLSIGLQVLFFHVLPIALMLYASPWFVLLYGAILFYLFRKEYYSAKMEYAALFLVGKP